jgi:hypothetical protein
MFLTKKILIVNVLEYLFRDFLVIKDMRFIKKNKEPHSVHRILLQSIKLYLLHSEQSVLFYCGLLYSAPVGIRYCIFIPP